MLEIGSSLREARRRRGIGLPDASAATMIRVRYLEALEDERVDALPEGPYQRSFLREYAEYLGLDGDILVAEWMARFTPPEPETPAPPPRRAQTLSPSLDAVTRRRALVAAVAVVVVALGAWQLLRSGSGSPTASPPPKPAPARQPVVHDTPPATPRPPQPKPHASLVLTAVHGPSWLLARLGSSAGRVLAEKTLQPGQTARFGLREPLWIRLGAPWNLAAAIGTRSVTAALPAVTGNVLVTARGIASA